MFRDVPLYEYTQPIDWSHWGHYKFYLAAWQIALT